MGKIIIAICLLIALWLLVCVAIEIDFPETADALSEMRRHIDELIAEKIRNEDEVIIEIETINKESE